MEKKALIEAGRIVNTHGVRGEVKIESWLDSPQFLKSFKRLYTAAGQELRVVSARVHKGFSAGSYKDLTRVARLNAQMWTELFLEDADFLSADAEADASVRQILRTRARYEVANNSYAKGIVLTLANDEKQTPYLQLMSVISRALRADNGYDRLAACTTADAMRKCLRAMEDAGCSVTVLS